MSALSKRNIFSLLHKKIIVHLLQLIFIYLLISDYLTMLWCLLCYALNSKRHCMFFLHVTLMFTSFIYLLILSLLFDLYFKLLMIWMLYSFLCSIVLLRCRWNGSALLCFVFLFLFTWLLQSVKLRPHWLFIWLNNIA